ncbi:unnamed protein product, partial [Acanthoscelides obtectus]
ENFGPLRRRPPIRIVLGEGVPGPESVQDHLVDSQFVRLARFPGVQRSGTRAHQQEAQHRRGAEDTAEGHRGHRRRRGLARVRRPGARGSTPTAHRGLTDRRRRSFGRSGCRDAAVLADMVDATDLR